MEEQIINQIYRVRESNSDTPIHIYIRVDVFNELLYTKQESSIVQFEHRTSTYTIHGYKVFIIEDRKHPEYIIAPIKQW